MKIMPPSPFERPLPSALAGGGSCSSGGSPATSEDCKMKWCNHCGDHRSIRIDLDSHWKWCEVCGRIIYQDEHCNKTLSGREEIQKLAEALHVTGAANMYLAYKLYDVAVDRNLTRSNHTSHVAAACLYIACRQAKKDFLLIDFSDYLQISIYVLGDIFLLLLQLEYAVAHKLTVACLFIHQFTECLLNGRNAVSETALRIIARMKNEWMKAGREPSILCGAALYMAALSHGFKLPKADTFNELLAKANGTHQYCEQTHLSKPAQVLCKHRNTGGVHFSCGLCKRCYNRFMRISGALSGFKNPAFGDSGRKKLKTSGSFEHSQESRQGKLKSVASHKIAEQMQTAECSASAASKTMNFGFDECSNEDKRETSELYSFLDVDDGKINKYFVSDEEMQFRKIMWDHMFTRNLEDHEAKEKMEAPKDVAVLKKSTRAKNTLDESCTVDAAGKLDGSGDGHGAYDQRDANARLDNDDGEGDDGDADDGYASLFL